MAAGLRKLCHRDRSASARFEIGGGASSLVAKATTAIATNPKATAPTNHPAPPTFSRNARRNGQDTAPALHEKFRRLKFGERRSALVAATARFPAGIVRPIPAP